MKHSRNPKRDPRNRRQHSKQFGPAKEKDKKAGDRFKENEALGKGFIFPDKIDYDFPVKDLATEIDKTQPELKKDLNAVTIIRKDGKHKVEISALKGSDREGIINKISQDLNIKRENIEIRETNKLELLRDLSPICVRAEKNLNAFAQGGSGAAFIESGSGTYLLTARHILLKKSGSDATYSEISVAPYLFMNGVSAKVEDHNTYVDADLAVLKLREKVSWTKKKDGSLNETAIASPERGKTVYVYGASSGKQKGTVRSVNASAKLDGQIFHNLIELEVHSQHGDSGAAVVNADHELIGLIVGGDPENSVVYCSNLSALKDRLGSYLSAGKLCVIDDRIKSVPKAKAEPKGLSPYTTSDQSFRRREVELWLRKGTLVKPASKDHYGEILTDDNIPVFTHHNYSYEVKDQVKQPVGETVWFFAVPLEYLVRHQQMAGTINHAPLLAVNITTTRKHLVSDKGLYKFTPCGTGTTIPSSTPGTAGGGGLAMRSIAIPAVFEPGSRGRIRISAKRRKKFSLMPVSRASKELRKTTYNNYIINDYGQLTIVRSDRQIQPWDKVIAQGEIEWRNTGLCNPRTERMRLCFPGFIPDHGWTWKPED